MVIKISLEILLSYLIGSIPTAYIFCKLYRGIDIRLYGSGNVGATNVFRVVGKVPGTLVLLIDILKGTLAVIGVPLVLGLEGVTAYILAGIAVVVGHNWTVFLKFQGGKGIATSLGVLIGLMIKIASIRGIVLLAIGIWIAVFLISGYVSLASIIATSFLPIFMIIFSQSFELIFLGVILCIFVVLRHRKNIKRLLSGEEHRFRPFHKR